MGQQLEATLAAMFREEADRFRALAEKVLRLGYATYARALMNRAKEFRRSAKKLESQNRKV